MKKLMLFADIFLLCVLGQAHERVFINEFLAHNVSIDADIVDFDDFSDWIELYNDENVDVDLGGYFLTDDPADPLRWQIPPGTIIKAKGFLRFWADGYDDVPGKTYQRPWVDQYGKRPYFTTRYYHLSFKLSRAGEIIELIRPDGAVADSVQFGFQMPDVSMGRQPDGSATWLYFGEPTPVAANITQGTLQTQMCASPAISLTSGFYATPRTIVLTANSSEAEIRYTLDGSKPTSAAEIYTLPLSIDETTVLRARVFQPGQLPSQIVTRTFFIDESCTLPVLSIVHCPETFWHDTLGIYAHNYKEREVPVHVDYFQKNGPIGFSSDAGLQLTGQASLYYPQKSFTIFARERFGADAITMQVFPQRHVNEFKSLYLRNAGVPDHRSTFFRDALQHTLVLNKMDIDCQAYQPAVIFLNGDYFGILNIRDKINSDYLASLHAVNPDAIDLLEYEGAPKPTVMSGDAENYQSLYTYIESTDLAVDDNYRHLESWMDIDEYINYQICEIYYDNVFWPDQNMRMWRERKEGAKWRWILFDTDFGFGMPNQVSKGVSNNTLQFAASANPDIPNPPPWATLIFRTLLQNDEFKTTFIQRFAGYLNTVFQPDTALAVIQQLQNGLAPEMARHISRWRSGDNYYGYPIPDYYTWVQNVNVLKNFAANRPKYQRQHIIDFFDLPGLCTINLAIQETEMGFVQINGVEQARGQSTRLYFKNVPTELKAIPHVGYRFVRWRGLANQNDNPVQVSTSEDSLNITAFFEPVSILSIARHISYDTTLEQAAMPYYALGTVTVDSGATLRLGSGVEILFPEQSSLVIHGRLLVEGSADAPVVFAPNEHATQWGAICFVNATDSSIISHLKIVGASEGVDFRDKAAISGYQSSFSLQDVHFERVQAPVYVQYGNVSIKDCRLHTDVPGDLINIKFAGSAIVENCEFCGNDGFDSDAIDYDHIANGIIRDNRIYNIYGTNSDAIDLGEAAHNILVEDNIIYNICDKGISIGGGSTAVVKRNVLVNCGQGAGIKDYNSYGRFEHNTFYGNQVGIACFEKNIGHGGGHADAVNCIFANSLLSAVIVDGLSHLDVSYSLSNQGDLPGLHNICAEPLFVNNLYPAAGSPAIDFGNPAFPLDPDGSLPDIGAYPFDPAQQRLIINEIHYHPQDDESEFVELLNAGAVDINLSGLRLSGDIQYAFKNEILAAGEYLVIARNASSYQGTGCQVVEWQSGRLPDGKGTVILMNEEGRMIDWVHYDNRFWWPERADGAGPSLELVSPALENIASSSWRCSYADGGTPGKANNSIILQGICINELLAGNSAVLADANGEYDDWIELYNSTERPIDVAGLFLTDNLQAPCRCKIPNFAAKQTTIPAHGFLLFWADGQSDQGVLHLNFKLNRADEQIGLVQVTENDTVFVDSLTYSRQTANISYGRLPDGADDWQFFDPPTPQTNNLSTDAGQSGLTAPIHFSLAQNYPNPFNAVTKIRFSLPESGKAELSVYDILGRAVVVLLDGYKNAGMYEIEFETSGLPSGLYLYRLRANGFTQTRKLLIIR